MKNKALFLDRDGVINVDYGYVHSVEKLKFVAGIFELCKVAQRLNYKIIIVTNQSGIARGYYTERTFISFMKEIKSMFADLSININGFYFCPHHPNVGNSYYKKDCFCRKPQPGMLLKAISEHCLDPNLCALVGDHPTDMSAGILAKVKKLFLYDLVQKPVPRDHYRIVSRLELIGKYLE